MDTIKTSFLPNLSMDSSVLNGTAAFSAFCPMCGQQFERAHQAAEHMQLCHSNVVTGMSSAGATGIILASPTPGTHSNVDTLKIDFPCYNCDDRFSSALELDEHNRMVHPPTVFIARCLNCGMIGTASTSDISEYKCLQCGSVCTAAALAAGQQNYLEQDAPQTPEELPAIAPKDMNLSPEEQQHIQQEQSQQQQQQQQCQQHVDQETQQQQQQGLHLQDGSQTSTQTQSQSRSQDDEQSLQQQLQQQRLQLQQHQQQQQSQHQQTQLQQQTSDNVELRVPPLTLKLNKNNDSATIANPQVIIKQEPLGDSNGEMPTNSIPVYTIHQPTGSTNTTASSNIVPKARHKCPDCPKTFKTPGTLAMHRKVHTGEAEIVPKDRPYTCSYCGKSFTQSNTLKQHTRIHTGEKPYRCGYCGRAFTVKDYLNKHLTTHTGEKPFRCLYCEKCFSVKDYLIKHIRTHTGEKPYTCPYCDKRFTQRSALTVHTTKLHPL